MPLVATAPLALPRFRTLWVASTVSNLGSFLQTVAASWLMLQLTGSATWVALMVASTTLPLLLFALPAGALADLFDRRRTLIVAQAVMALAALAMAALAWAGLATPGRLLGLGLVLGAGFAFNLPTWHALIPDVVPREQVPGAVALNSASFNVARAVGPALGGILVAAAGPGWAFALNAVSYLAVIAALMVSTGRSRAEASGESSVVGAIALGVRYARFTPPVRRLLGLATGFALTSAVVQATLPNFTESTLGGDALAYGLLLGAMGVGALAGAVLRPRVSERLGGAMVPAAICGFGLAAVGVGLSRALPVAALGMLVAGATWVWTLATLNATTQLLSPGWVRGRIMSLYTLAFLGVVPLGSILAGVLADAVGVPRAFVAFGLATVALGLVAFRLRVPVLGEVAAQGRALEPLPADEVPPHAADVGAGPVTVVNTWRIAAEDTPDFLAVMGELRLVRLRTGARRWELYRDVDDPGRFTEAYVLPTWGEHLSQLAHMDRAGGELVRRARAYDRSGGPRTDHLAGVDVGVPATL